VRVAEGVLPTDARDPLEQLGFYRPETQDG
jgi:hypothetical protein